MVKRLPRWLRNDLSADDLGLRERAEEALAAMFLALEVRHVETSPVEVGGNSIPWEAPATISIRRKRETDFTPQMAGLSFGQAIEHVMTVRPDPNTQFCIWVTWEGSQYRFGEKELLLFVNDPTRPNAP